MAKGNCTKSCRIASILLTSWSESGVCELGTEITVALHDGSGVARHKQQFDGREHNGLKNGLKF